MFPWLEPMPRVTTGGDLGKVSRSGEAEILPRGAPCTRMAESPDPSVLITPGIVPAVGDLIPCECVPDSLLLMN